MVITTVLYNTVQIIITIIIYFTDNCQSTIELYRLNKQWALENNGAMPNTLCKLLMLKYENHLSVITREKCCLITYVMEILWNTKQYWTAFHVRSTLTGDSVSFTWYRLIKWLSKTMECAVSYCYVYSCTTPIPIVFYGFQVAMFFSSPHLHCGQSGGTLDPDSSTEIRVE